MHVETPSHASWVWQPGSAAPPRNPVGWKPVQLVPENAGRGRGGFPLSVGSQQNQAIWIKIYTGRNRPPGLGLTRLAVGDPAGAVAAFRESLKLNQKQTEVRRTLADLRPQTQGR
jgi:hypothetical protein